MGALPAGNGNISRDASPRGASPHGGAATAADLALGLQLCRAGLLSLTRLQLAVERGDRPRVMEAVDDLHALDVSIGRTVDALPVAPADERLAAVARRLQEEKMALAFEKLALASGVSGPALSSGPARRARSGAPRDGEAVADWPVRERRAAGRWAGHALRVAVFLAVAAGTVGVLVAAL